MNKAPCKDCPNRHQGCHSECDKYIAFRKERDELNELKHKEKEKHRLLVEYNKEIGRRYMLNKKGWR
jgi:hypothetical protein